MRKNAGFAPENSPKHPKMTSKAEHEPFATLKHQYSGLNRPRHVKMKLLNKAREVRRQAASTSSLAFECEIGDD
jgi:hypothetical protein